MEIIKQYRSLDGRVFGTQEACLAQDKIVLRVKEIMIGLQDLPKEDSCRFANGEGYIQQDKKIVDKARIELTEYSNTVFDIKHKASFGWIGRYFDDSGNSTLYHAWGRLSHIDHLYREWGQGYYAVNPTAGVQEPFIERD